MLLTIITNEWRNLLRSRIAVLLLGILFVLAVFTIWQSYSAFEKLQHARNEATTYMRQKFTGQGTVNPHSAAHYGHFVYKPITTLSVFDEGITPYTGLSLRLEGHRQNEATFAQAQESSSLIRFGQLNLGLVLQVLLPLFMLFICYNTISREKENGNLPLILVQGNSLRKLIWGKTLAYTIVWVAYLSVTLGVLWLFTITGNEVTSASRLGGTWLLYSLYYFIITAIAVYISAKSKTSSNALLTLLFAWLACTVLLPKATANIGDTVTPLITRMEMDKRISEDNKNGIDGHNPRNERTKKFADSLLAAYKVDSASQVPVNIDGLAMQADEEYHNTVYDRHLGTVKHLIQQQNRTVAYSSFINPFTAVSNISMSLSGTDDYHHFDFLQKAEDYRRIIIKKMNDEQAYGGSKTGDWDWAVDAGFWEKIEDFYYAQPAAQWSLQHNTIEITALLLWLIFISLTIHFTANRINIKK